MMTRKRQQRGFSLTETLMAVATLAIGLTFIAGTFLTGIYFATLSTERTIAAVVAEEAFAKVLIFRLDPNDPDLKADGFTPYEDLVTLPADEFRYPSVRDQASRQYSWAAICRQVVDGNNVGPGAGGDLVQCVVFVSRQTGERSSYWKRKSGGSGLDLESTDLPRPMRVNVAQQKSPATPDELVVKDAVTGDATDERTFLSEGAILVDDATGEIYRMLERSPVQVDRVKLDRNWAGGDLTSGSGGWVWVVPPAAAGGRNPCVAVYQKILRFSRP